MKLYYDRHEDALYIEFNRRPYRESNEVSEGIIFDYDNVGKIIGIEILNVSKQFPREFKATIEKQPAPLHVVSRQPVRLAA